MVNDKPVILFDGICNFCNAMVNFMIRQDKKNVFLFCALQSDPGKKILEQYKINWRKSDSFVMIENGKAFQKSNGALRMYNRLPWYWKWTQVFWIFPRFIRDGIYNLIAKNRYRWFGKKDVCMIPSPGVKEKFLN